MAVGVRGVDYSRWDHIEEDSEEEDERPATQTERISAHLNLEHTQRLQEIDDELVSAKAQLATYRQQRKALDEASRAQGAQAVSSSQWMLIGGSSFVRVPSKKVAETLSSGARANSATQLAAIQGSPLHFVPSSILTPPALLHAQNNGSSPMRSKSLT